MRALKNLINDLDISLGKNLLKVHSNFSRCLKDIVYSAIKGLNNSDFGKLEGKVNLITKFKVIEGEATKRGAGGYSFGFFFDEIPQEFIEIINKHKPEIEAYLGKGFLYEKAQFWRNYKFPSWAESFDILSNIWHMDSHDGNRFLKIFINLSDVRGIEDGAFMYLDREGSIKNFYEIYNRWEYGMQREVKPKVFSEQILFTSEPGGYLIVNAGNCFHRATNPSKSRDIMQIALYPSWRKDYDRKVYSF